MSTYTKLSQTNLVVRIKHFKLLLTGLVGKWATRLLTPIEHVTKDKLEGSNMKNPVIKEDLKTDVTNVHICKIILTGLEGSRTRQAGTLAGRCIHTTAKVSQTGLEVICTPTETTKQDLKKATTENYHQQVLQLGVYPLCQEIFSRVSLL